MMQEENMRGGPTVVNRGERSALGVVDWRGYGGPKPLPSGGIQVGPFEGNDETGQRPLSLRHYRLRRQHFGPTGTLHAIATIDPTTEQKNSWGRSTFEYNVAIEGTGPEALTGRKVTLSVPVLDNQGGRLRRRSAEDATQVEEWIREHLRANPGLLSPVVVSADEYMADEARQAEKQHEDDAAAKGQPSSVRAYEKLLRELTPAHKQLTERLEAARVGLSAAQEAERAQRRGEPNPLEGRQAV